jgi:hypothetical protein
VSHGNITLRCISAFWSIRPFVFTHHWHCLSMQACNSINGLDSHSGNTSQSTKTLRCTWGAVMKLHASLALGTSRRRLCGYLYHPGRASTTHCLDDGMGGPTLEPDVTTIHDGWQLNKQG